MKKQFLFLSAIMILFAVFMANCEKPQLTEDVIRDTTGAAAADRATGVTIKGTENLQICGQNMGTTTCQICNAGNGTLSRPGTEFNLIVDPTPASYMIINVANTKNNITVTVPGTGQVITVLLLPLERIRVDIDAANVATFVAC